MELWVVRVRGREISGVCEAAVVVVVVVVNSERCVEWGRVKGVICGGNGMCSFFAQIRS